MKARILPETQVKEVVAVDAVEMLRQASEKAGKAMQASVDELFCKLDEIFEDIYKATSSAAAAAPSPQGEGLRRNAEDSVPYKKK